MLSLAFKWLETKSATVNLFADKASKWGPYYTAEQINEALDEVMLGECITIVGFLEVRAAAKINEQIRNVIFSKQFKFDLQFFANKGTSKTINASDLKMSKTVQNHINDIVKKGPYKGELARPYIDSNGTPLLIDEIMQAGTPVKDTVLKNGLRWDVQGTFRGSTGTWELVVDTSTNTIVHFNFVAK